MKGGKEVLWTEFKFLEPTIPEAQFTPTLDFPITRKQLFLCFNYVAFLSLATERDPTHAGVAKDKIKK